MSISKNIQDLSAIYQEKIDGLTDSLTKAKAQIALDAYKEAEQAYQEQVKVTAASYTGPGMTVSKRSAESSRNIRDMALADLEGILGIGDGGVLVVDFGGCI